MVTQIYESFGTRTDNFIRVFESPDRVQGFTHDFYKYPARFSPNFTRYIIEEFTKPGDYVLDPFMGGGTTIVEAMSSGRRVIGSDINELSRFVTIAKTTPMSRRDISEIRSWVLSVRDVSESHDADSPPGEIPIRNMPAEAFPFFSTATRLAESLLFPRQQHFARCSLLRVGQWALDASSTIPKADELCDALEDRVERMLSGLAEFVSASAEKGVHKNKITGTRKLLGCSASDPLLVQTLQSKMIQPKLVLTSPPYPGVHILYHRWQVLGRRETPAPYWIAGIRDGLGESHYTMGSRTELGLTNYFRGIKSAFTNIRRVVDQDSRIVQLISFSDSASQLPRYLETMQAAGFEETNEGCIGSRQVRLVPNRKWYTRKRPQNDASREVMLIHRPSH